ncbi:MAG: bifunctional isocitrate dehydrogenase kinase/phosphatase [Burkholderiales bacterium]|jgi:isocitrate dehydrogenase kinase/phosphatase|nr:bifunctional isocitrate dehydrogenase kinase/phosphatase [Burkholderiales bacterium]
MSADRPAAIARAIVEGFDRHYRLFRYVAQQAKGRFENGDWQGMREFARERIDFYDTRVREAVARIEGEFALAAMGADAREALWPEVKAAYVSLLAEHRQPECAETFFNSVSTKLLHREYFNNAFIFVRPGVATEYMDSEPPSYRCYYPTTEGLRATLRRILLDFGLACGWEDFERDCRRLLRAVLEAHRAGEAFHRPWHAESDCQVQVLSTLFFRNKAAYVVARLINGTRLTPIAVPIQRNARGRLYLDTALFTTDLLATLFSFTRAYFLVDMEAPSAYIDFLRALLPHKPASELYTMVGLQKQGKTLFYRDFLHHLRHSHDQFAIAPGIKGLVMTVFTLPSYPYVFKVIKDVIPHPKETDREQIMAKYQLVKMHDRVGRMADTWEYSQVALPRARCAPELLRELRDLCPSQLEITDDTVVIDHVYIERRMTPLNIYLTHATDAELEHAVREYGQAIKDLAAANIFPGDMLYKNFGVTRLNRVVFYDYDEIEYMTDCNFRYMPQPGSADEDWDSEMTSFVDKRDMFPEQWRPFLTGDPRIRAALLKHHADLFDPDFWRSRKERIQRGILEDVYPYPPERRFTIRYAENEGASRRKFPPPFTGEG